MKKLYLKKETSEKAKGLAYIGVKDGFCVADIYERKIEKAGKAAVTQRKKSDKHVDKIVKSLKKEKTHYAWNILISINGDVEIHEEELFNRAGELVSVESYIWWPETEEEMDEFADKIEIIDGQHRCAALTNKYALKDIFGSYDVTITILDHPSEAEIIRQFIALNGRGKNMSKELLFNFSAAIGDLDADVAAARELLVMANEDPKSPMYGKIKFGESGGALSSSTIVNRFVSTDGFSLIQEMEMAGMSTHALKYNFFLKVLKAIDEENRVNDAKSKKANKEYKVKSISATKYGATIATVVPSVLTTSRIENKNKTVDYIQDVYHTLINDVLCVKNIRDRGNEAIRYSFENPDWNVPTCTVKDRYNGNAGVNGARPTTINAVVAARQNFLRAEVLK